MAIESVRRARLLIVEDEEMIRRLLVRSLGLRGWRTNGVSDGEAALVETSRAGYDVVLCDLMMEGLDGFQTLARLREAHPSLVLVVMTAYDTPENRLRAERIGARSFVPKPFDLEALHVLLAGLLPEDGPTLESA